MGVFATRRTISRVKTKVISFYKYSRNLNRKENIYQTKGKQQLSQIKDNYENQLTWKMQEKRVYKSYDVTDNLNVNQEGCCIQYSLLGIELRIVSACFQVLIGGIAF